MGAENFVQVHHSEGLAMSRSSHAKIFIQLLKMYVLSKQCAMGNLFEEACFLKLCRF